MHEPQLSFFSWLKFGKGQCFERGPGYSFGAKDGCIYFLLCVEDNEPIKLAAAGIEINSLLEIEPALLSHKTENPKIQYKIKTEMHYKI